MLRVDLVGSRPIWPAHVGRVVDLDGCRPVPSDIRLGWRPANDPDLDMVGTLVAHAEFPPGCEWLGPGLPKPVHFDDTEHAWSIGAVAGAFDVESVALHEIGHILGLYHSSVPAAVMWPTVYAGTTKRTLANDDLAGYRALYPYWMHASLWGHDPAANKTTILVIDIDGRLAQLRWASDQWHLDYPAHLAGYTGRFLHGVAVVGRDPAADKKTIIAVTTDGRLAQLWDTDRWNISFPAELAGYPPKVQWDGAAVVGRDPAANKKTIIAVTTDGRLAQIWDTDRWNIDFPAELARV